MQYLIELRERLHNTGVTSAVHYQYVLRVLLSGNTRLDVFFWLSWTNLWSAPLINDHYLCPRPSRYIKKILEIKSPRTSQSVIGWSLRVVCMVVYHLHGQTSRFKVCADGMQNPGLGKFLVESHLPFNKQIISINRKTAAKLWSWYQRWLWRNENTNFWLEHSVQRSYTSGAFH